MAFGTISIEKLNGKLQPIIRSNGRQLSVAVCSQDNFGHVAESALIKEIPVEFDENQGNAVNVRLYPTQVSTVRNLIKPHGGKMNPSLLADKFTFAWKKSEQARLSIENLVETANVQAGSSDEYLDRMNQRLSGLCKTQSGHHWTRTTESPVTIHLSRSGALENSGVCLHRPHGFAYIPGTSVKGMAHAYACDIWFPREAAKEAADPQKLWLEIIDIFGAAPSPWLCRSEEGKAFGLVERLELRIGKALGFLLPRFDDKAKPNRKDTLETWNRSGAAVFHDALPTRWPRLIVDIVNSHHTNYYSAKESNVPPPGDWEDPSMVHFPAIDAGTEFNFALSPVCGAPFRKNLSGKLTEELISRAKEFVNGAMDILGVGAKTSAGYGAFSGAAPTQQSNLPLDRLVFETTLTLVTPAFLAGAHQTKNDCTLRGATLRGQLRWWWRTMHAGTHPPGQLRALENRIWGSSGGGGAIRIRLTPCFPNGIPVQFDKFGKAKMAPHTKATGYGIIWEKDINKISQGLHYLAFGMHDKSDGQTRRRFYLDPGSSWKLTIIARDVRDTKANTILQADQVLVQAKAALGLLAKYGACGARSRRGFGCFKLSNLDVDVIEQLLCDVAAMPRNIPEPQSPVFPPQAQTNTVTFKWQNIWAVLDQVGFALQSFAKKEHHYERKWRLGLPRKTVVTGTQPDVFDCTALIAELKLDWKRVDTPAHLRHASPLHVHISGTPGAYNVQLFGFPAGKLDTYAGSLKYLQFVCVELQKELNTRSALLEPTPEILVAPRETDRGAVKSGGNTGGSRPHAPNQRDERPQAPLLRISPPPRQAAMEEEEWLCVKKKKAIYVIKRGEEDARLTKDVPVDDLTNKTVVARCHKSKRGLNPAEYTFIRIKQ